ncbi:MAG: isochorismatase family protein [Proteobacteria bacterium]|nr:isochorismatase family protein [Pseudomonadota bacterium]
MSEGLQPGQRPALIVIDFVKAYITPGTPLYGAACVAAQKPAQALLAMARTAGIPRVHTNLAYDADGRNGGVFFRKLSALSLFAQGAPPEAGEFAPGLEPRSGETVITKQYASAFFGTTLAATLTALRVDTLIIAGVSTSGCIRATAVDACQHGFIPWVVREAVGDRSPAQHEANLFDLQAKYAEVVDLKTVEEYLGAHRRS